jgi:hypothetical protein
MGGAMGARVYVGNGDIPIGIVSDINFSSNQIQISMGASISGGPYFSGGGGNGGDAYTTGGGGSGSFIINSEGMATWGVMK